MKATFFSMVTNHFQYLVAEYGFAVRKVEESKRAPETEGRIEFESSKAFVTVSCEQWMANVAIGRVHDDKYRFFLDPLIIHEYVALTALDRELVCSLDPRDDRKIKMIIRQTVLSPNKNSSSNVVEDIDNQLAYYSDCLRQYGGHFLRGDFSQWLDIYEYRVFRARAAHIRSGKEEFVRTTGKNKSERVSIFQSNLDYLAKLRQEYGKRQS